MDNFIIASLVAVFSIMIGIMCGIMLRPYLKNKTKKKLPIHICNIVFILGLSVYISFLLCIGSAEHKNSNIGYIKYPIQKLTINRIYFNDNEYSLNESYVIVEDPNKEYKNVVIVEEEKFTLQWLFKINISDRKYHIYLSEEIYNRLQNKEVIYEQ